MFPTRDGIHVARSLFNLRLAVKISITRPSKRSFFVTVTPKHSRHLLDLRLRHRACNYHSLPSFSSGMIRHVHHLTISEPASRVRLISREATGRRPTADGRGKIPHRGVRHDRFQPSLGPARGVEGVTVRATAAQSLAGSRPGRTDGVTSAAPSGLVARYRRGRMRSPRPMARRDDWRRPRVFRKRTNGAAVLGASTEHYGPRATPSSQCVFTRG